MFRKIALFAAVALFVALIPFAARASVQTYRFQILTISGAYRYATPVAPKSDGFTYEVNRDALGRIARVAFYHDALKTGEWRYVFKGSGALPIGYDSYLAGKLTDRGKMVRDARGYIVRDTGSLPSGEFSYDTKQTTSGLGQTSTTYGPSGGVITRVVRTFNASGDCTSGTVYSTASDKDYVVNEVNPNRGLTLTQKAYVNGVYDHSVTYFYNQSFEVYRSDAIDTGGKVYASNYYEHGLMVRKIYADASNKEIRLTYDDRRILSLSQLYINGQLLVHFTFDRKPDGTIIKTQAWGNDGSLWAEYPNKAVNDVDRNGVGPGGVAGTMTKAAPWW